MVTPPLSQNFPERTKEVPLIPGFINTKYEIAVNGFPYGTTGGNI